MDRLPERSLTSPRAHFREHIGRIARAAIASVDPRALMAQAAAVPPLKGLVGHTGLAVIAAGKAAGGMVEGLRAAVGRPARGLGVALRLAVDRDPRLEWQTGGHPTPTDSSVRAGRAALSLAATIGNSEQLVVLLSGGASALLAVPVEGLSLEAKMESTRALLDAGVPIEDLNCVRKHLSAIKGGWLAARATGPIVTLAISDVVRGDDLSVIGSGPTVADPTTFGDALTVVERAGVGRRFPRQARDVLERGAAGALPETLKPGDARLRQSAAVVIGGRQQALTGALDAAAKLGYRTVVLSQPTEGEARQAGPRLVAAALELASATSAVCLLAAGETTVRVVGGGRGGRNQELTLSATRSLAAAGHVALASIGTDGIDGPTDAAGAFADATTLGRAEAAGLGPAEAFLERNDAYAYFDRLGDLIRTGATGTNVGDLQIVLVDRGLP